MQVVRMQSDVYAKSVQSTDGSDAVNRPRRPEDLED